MNDPGGHQSRDHRLWSTRTLRNGLVLVVLAALLPMAILSVVQGRVAWDDTRTLAMNQLRANAGLFAEGERDVFIIARHSLQAIGRARSVVQIEADCNAVLAGFHRATTGIINFTRSDTSGRVQCSALPFDPKASFADKAWWQHAVKIDGFSLSAPTIGTISKKPVLIMALPIHTADGRQDGLLTAAISLEALRKSLQQRSAADPKALVEVVGADSAVILSNRKGTLDIPARPTGTEQLTTARSPDGREWLYAVAPLHGKDLSVIYAEPLDELLATAVWRVRQSFLLPLIAMVLASLAIWTGTHWLVVRWLRKLQVLAANFGRGDYVGNRQAFLHAPPEVAALSDDLHTMAETIERRDTALNLALAAKTSLTREVNHRVKNNLQIVTSLLTLQADRVADPWARDALGQAKARIAALGLIHRVLYEHDTHNELGSVNMRLLMAELCPQLRAANRAFADVDLRCNCGNLAISVDQAVPLTLLIVEAVTNAFRHAFAASEAGVITVHIDATDSHVDLTITDNGCGYTVADPVGKMGFELMTAFSSQLRGQLAIESTAAGTQVRLHYPITPY